MGYRGTQRTKDLSPEQQCIRLRSSQISQGRGYVRLGELTWKFDVQPHPLSRTYTLQIRFRKNSSPKVFVLHPNLKELAGGRKLPHVYSSKLVQLCLYFPGDREWTPDKSIVETLVPWAYLWLMYFEYWLATNEWQGGGMHPGEKNAEK
jgi:hypothetical protein